MNISEEVCISLLRKSLWNTKVIIHNTLNDWEGVIKVSQNQSVLGTLCHAVMSENFEIEIPQDYKDKLKLYCPLPYKCPLLSPSL